MMRVVGSGALNLDFFYEIEDLRLLKSSKGLVPGGEVWGSRKEFEVLREELEQKGRFIAQSGGGSAANTIFALKTWGFETGFIGIVGADEEGEAILAELEGVDLSRVIRRGYSACCLIIIDAQKDRAILVSPHSEEPSLTHFSCQTNSDEWLHLSSLITDEGFSFHCQLKKNHPGPFSIDPGEIYARRGFEALKNFFQKAKLVFITSQELEILKIIPEEITAFGPKLFLKQGGKGATIYDGKPKNIPPATPPEIVDNTGAGDVFDAGVIAGILSGLSLEKAGKLGAAMAAISLRDYARKGYPLPEEFSAKLKEIKNATG
ncbi:carbohydrate kinase family protein [Thermodesulfatator indicus]